MPKPAERARKAAVGLREVLNAIRYWPVRVAAAMLPIPGARGFLSEAIHEFALHIDGPPCRRGSKPRIAISESRNHDALGCCA
jgi:hypothetical protein